MAITSLGMNIFTTYSGRGLGAARRDVRRLEGTLLRMKRVDEAFSTAGVNALRAAAVVTAPALITLGQGALYVGGAFAAMAVSAGVAGGIFGGVMFAAANQALAMKAAGEKLNGNQREFITHVGWMSDAWKKFLNGAGSKTLEPLSTAVNAVRRGIAFLPPVINAVLPIANKIANAFSRWVYAESGFRRFLGVITKYGVPAFDNLHKAARNFLGFLGHGFRAFAPEGVKMAQILNRGARAMNHWAKNGGFQRFIASVKAHGPEIREFFRALWAAFKNVAVALAGMAPAALRVATILLQMIAALPPGVIQAMAYAYTLWRLSMMAVVVQIIALKGAMVLLKIQMITMRVLIWGITLAQRLHTAAARMNIVTLIAQRAAIIGTAIAQRAAAVASRLWAAATWLVNIAMRANPILLIVSLIATLVAAIIWVATRTRFFQTVWSAVWGFVRRVASAVWGALRAGWRFTANIIMGLFRWIGNTAPKVWRVLWGAVRAVGRVVWGGIRAGWRFTARIVLTLFRWVSKGARVAWRFMWNVVRKVGSVVWKFIRGAWRTTARIVLTLFRWLSKGARVAWRFMWNIVRKVARGVWNFLRGAWRGLTRTIVRLFRWLSKIGRAVWRGMWNLVRKIARGVWNFLRGAWRALTRVFVRLFRWLSKTGRSIWRTLWRVVRAVARGVWNFLRGAWNRLTRGIVRVFRWLRKVGSAVWRGLWNFIRNFAKKTWGWVRKGVNGFVRGVRAAFQWCIRQVKRIWGGLKAITRGPVKFFVEVVYNKGLRAAWNNTFAKIPGVKELAKAKVGFASGGKIPGSGDGRTDRVPIMAAPGEYVLRRRAVRRIGVRNLDAMNTGRTPGNGASAGLNRSRTQAMNMAGFNGWKGHALGGPVRGMFLGGLIDDLGGFVKGVAKIAAGGFGGIGNTGAFDWSSGIFMDVVGPLTKAFFKPFRGAIDKLWKKHPGAGMWNKFIHGTAEQGFQQLIDFLFSIAQDTGSGFSPFRPWQEGDGRRVRFGGVTVNYRTALMLRKAQRLAKTRWNMFQGSFSNSVGASAGTHSGGGAADLGPTSNKNVGALRASGFAAWNRGKKWQSPSFPDHIHAIAVGDKQLSGAARAQVRAFFRGRNGLANNGPDNWVPPGGKGGGVQRWRGLAARAMRMGGLKVTGYTLGRFLALMAKESGGNPRAINRWDSNARSGNASRGLMQVIPSTFRANHVKGTSMNIFDPLANMAAAARYIKRRYGGRVPNSPYALGGLINSFDKGGLLPTGLSLAYNGTGRPEPVGHDLGGEVHVHVHGNVYTKSTREFEDMIVKAVTSAESKGRLRTAGRRRGA